LLPYILFEKYIYILALKMASPENQHCAKIASAHFRSLYRFYFVIPFVYFSVFIFGFVQ